MRSQPGSPYLHIAPPSEEGDDKVPAAATTQPVNGADKDGDDDAAKPEILPDENPAEPTQGAG